MRPRREEIEKIARHLKRTTGRVPNSIALARHLQTAYEMDDSEFMRCLDSCRSVARRINGVPAA